MNNFLYKYQSFIGKVNYLLFLVVVALLPFPQLFSRHAWILWIGCWILEGRFLSKPKLNEWRKMLPFLFFGAWFLWKAISGLWAQDDIAYNWLLERYIMFGLLVPVGIWGVNSHYDWKQICRVLVIACIAAAGVYAFTIFWVYNNNIFYNEIGTLPTNEFPFDFFAEKISFIKHRLFLSSIMMMGIMALLYIRKDICQKRGTLLGWIMIVIGIAIMASLIIATGSRASILSGAALITIALLYKLPIRKIKYKIALIVFAGFIGTFALLQHPRMSNFSFEEAISKEVDKYDEYVRLNIWRIALHNRDEYSLYGVGAGQSFGYLQEKYADYNITQYSQLNAHNQYLEEWIEIGIPGMVFFILAWLSLVVFVQGEGRKTAILLFTLYSLNMLTDCMFGRFDGIALWGVIMILIRIQSNTQSHQQPTGDTQ